MKYLFLAIFTIGSVGCSSNKEPALRITAPKGYEISSGYRFPYFNQDGQLRWRNMSFSGVTWGKEITESGCIFQDTTTDTDIVIFIRKVKK